MSIVLFFFFKITPTTEIYTLSLHDALPILADCLHGRARAVNQDTSRTTPDPDGDAAKDQQLQAGIDEALAWVEDRKSTRLNSSHSQISYAVFCLKKKKKQKNLQHN